MGYAAAEQRTYGVSFPALHMDGIEPARPKHISDPSCVRFVGLVAHGRKRRIHLPRFHADNVEPCST